MGELLLVNILGQLLCISIGLRRDNSIILFQDDE